MINSEIFGATTPGPWGGRAGVAGLRLTVTVIAVDWQHMLLAVDQKGPKDGAGEALFFLSPNLTASALMEGRSFLLEVALFIVWTTVGWSEGADIGGVTKLAGRYHHHLCCHFLLVESWRQGVQTGPVALSKCSLGWNFTSTLALKLGECIVCQTSKKCSSIPNDSY